MITPSAGSRVMTTSQNARELWTPWPSTCGQFNLAGSVRIAVAGAAVVRRVCAIVAGVTSTVTSSAATHPTNPTRRSVIDAHQAGGIGGRSHHGCTVLDQLEKLHAGTRVVPEDAEHGAGHCKRVLLFDAAHRHAQVSTLADHRHAARVDRLEYRLRDLVRHALLNLQAPREHVDEPRDLAQPDDPRIRNVRDMTLAEERQQVVFAQAVEINVLDDDHLAV